MRTNLEYFESLGRLVDTINRRPINEEFRWRLDNKELNSSHKLGIKFSSKDSKGYGTADYETSERYALEGDYESFKKVKKAFDKVVLPNLGEEFRRKVSTDIVGCAPIVPLALIGVPQNMMKVEQRKQSAKVLNVIYRMSMDWTIKEDQIIAAGVRLLRAIQAIERAGVKVNLYAGFAMECSKELNACIVKIKPSTTPVSAFNSAYAMINPAMFRRTIFYYYETAPVVTKGFSACYGFAVTSDEFKQAMSECRNIPNQICLDNYELWNGNKSVQDIAEMIIKECNRHK